MLTFGLIVRVLDSLGIVNQDLLQRLGKYDLACFALEQSSAIAGHSPTLDGPHDLQHDSTDGPVGIYEFDGRDGRLETMTIGSLASDGLFRRSSILNIAGPLGDAFSIPSVPV